MKCKRCGSCFQKPIINNELYFYCYVCNKYYKYDKTRTGVVDVTTTVNKLIKKGDEKNESIS